MTLSAVGPAANHPPGIVGVHVLPADHHDGPWDSIITPPEVKERLLGTALLVLRHGWVLGQLGGAPHGLVLLSGPPGTGKTTLCQGLAQKVALALAPRGATTFVEVDPHAFPSDMLGEGPRAVQRLFSDTLPELAARRPHTIVLVDEIEALAVRRSTASFETNPVDVHRATDALLSGLDMLRTTCPQVLVLGTTNFAAAVDEAFLDRADLVLRLGLPDRPTVERILRESLAEAAGIFPGLLGVAFDEALIAELAERCTGLDGRRVRKLVLSAMGSHPEVALDPGLMTADHLRAAVDAELPARAR
ncbi:ATPase family associated with various cellular activities (AAA) [Blastococcus sp. DSM 46786]|uniref:AAA family ATPase n=1 Tax=Blastococcus sp. DSM 46786 TaxID=1798227 RepID=UPI0008B3FE23|nr:AAA family ATPase [Blastococcus sp. DSM 46786]SEK91720.1 ATPase family associated with various cellular activities (AAA) [Blastococcus sp. DSM 46786]